MATETMKYFEANPLKNDKKRKLDIEPPTGPS